MALRPGLKPATEAEFGHEAEGDGLRIRLRREGRDVRLDQWGAPATSVLASLESQPDVPGDMSGAVVGDTSAWLSAGAVARLDQVSAAALGLPPPTALALDLRCQGRIHEDDFRIRVRWVRPGGVAVNTQIIGGCLIRTPDADRRIAEPIWSLWRGSLALEKPLAQVERFKALAELRASWPDDVHAAIETDGVLRDLRVHYASGMGLKLRALTPDLTDFDPVLFGAPEVARAEADGRSLDETLDAALTPYSQRRFAEDRFRREAGGRPVYVLGEGEYVFIDPALRPALHQVRLLQNAPERERRAFVLNPRRVLRERLGEDADRIDLERVFVETEQFSARVAGVDVWCAPVLPWLVPPSAAKWVPETFGLKIGDELYSVAPERLPELVERAGQAEARGEDSVAVGDILVPGPGQGGAPPDRMPLTPQAQEAIGALGRLLETPISRGSGEAEPPWKGPGKLFLLVRENFEEIGFSLAPEAGADPAGVPPIEPPARLRSRLKPHQQDGLVWLANAHLAGSRGALLADDMGLGKTLQAIAFMAWLQDQAALGQRPRAPFLIVAPTGLLGAWRKEIDEHLHEPHLGRTVLAFGAALKSLRDEDAFSGADIDNGAAALSASAWNDAGVVLTTYETLRDYHFSFARTRFGLVVWDEIQKLKNPASQLARAAKTINADFTLGMTGTPVENRLQDLWAIMDVVVPGALGLGRDFERRYPAHDAKALSSLKRLMTEPEGSRPPWMLRRLKADALPGLPKKTIQVTPLEMPAAQADAYRQAVNRAAAMAAAGALGRGGMLAVLGALRGLSLHPLAPASAGHLSSDDYVGQSARLRLCMKTLEQIAAKKEKALIFVEDLAMQAKLAAMIQAKFALSARPMIINGNVPGPRRQEMVGLFQSHGERFDVMILSPRAGGVGLTLTAANHVIHLSRWWNPAVEDQATDRVHRIGQTRDVFIHIPQAVHPDPLLGESSFDLRLHELIERKRQLTRDFLLPGDASSEDLAALFNSVTATPDASSDDRAGEARTELPEPKTRQETSSRGAPADASPTATPRHVNRPAGFSRWRRASGDPRPLPEIAALFAGLDIERIIIRDPYALAHANARDAQVRFVQAVARDARSLSAVTVEYADDAQGDVDEAVAQRDFYARLTRAFPSNAPRPVLRGHRRRRDEDFHDRLVSVFVRRPGATNERHELMIGRGVESLFNDRLECNVVYIPPT